MERFMAIDNNNRCLKNAITNGFCNVFNKTCTSNCQFCATNDEADAVAALMIISPIPIVL